MVSQLGFFEEAKQTKPAAMPVGSLIYEPRGRAHEYADLACNIYKGCDHACVYCYAPSATYMQRPDFEISKPRSSDFLAKLEKEARAYGAANCKKQILLCFTCDPYQTLDASTKTTREVIKIFKRNNLRFVTLTKGGNRALRDIDLFGPLDAFASSLTLLDTQQSEKWEPGAASPQNRIDTIREFYACGITTWVSLEPVIDPEQSVEIIRQTSAFVDLFKVGKLNYHPRSKEIDWRKFTHDAVDLLQSLGKSYYVKNDLEQFLDGRPKQV
jgi:DNA repair photolyase